jgi:dihydropteroate synthase
MVPPDPDPIEPADLRLGPRVFGRDDLVVMAIVNRTPDSFFDSGATFAERDAQLAVDRAVSDGAAIVDVGGVKAGPGDPVDVAEEIQRTAPFVRWIRRSYPDVVISVDSWRRDVARAACDAGADLVNDAWGGADPGIFEVAAEFGAGYVCAHAGGQRPRARPHRVAYDDVMADILAATGELAARAVDAGIARDRLLLDPAHDFGKNTRHSLEATRRLGELVATGWPVLVSLSNKDFVGETLDLPVTSRGPGTLAATAVCAWLGARVFRAHDVAATRQVLEMVSAIRGTREPAVSRRGLA